MAGGYLGGFDIQGDNDRGKMLEAKFRQNLSATSGS